jgi:uncharacterized membrane protein
MNIAGSSATDVSCRLWMVGWSLMSVGIAGLGTAQLLFAAALPDLVLIDLSRQAARLSGLLLAGCGIAMLAKRHSLAAATTASILATFAAIAFFASANGKPASLTTWVPLAELLTFAVAALSGVRGHASGRPLRACLGSALLLFGAIHLQFHDAIASMIPQWIPWAGALPFATGVIQLAAGLAILLGRGTRTAGTGVGLLFLSWLPLVHAPRLIGNPFDNGEWSFALIALALAGCALMAGANRRLPDA